MKNLLFQKPLSQLSQSTKLFAQRAFGMLATSMLAFLICASYRTERSFEEDT